MNEPDIDPHRDQHARGVDDGKALRSQVNDEICDRRHTSNQAGYGQMAGLMKAQIQASTRAYTATGHDPGPVRFGLHDHGQYHPGRVELVWGLGPRKPQKNEQIAEDLDGKPCDLATVIPSQFYRANLADVLDITGVSSYTERPSNIDEMST